MELKGFCSSERGIQIFRELTKKFEENIGSNIDMVLNHFEDKEIIGEITVVIEGNKNETNIEFDSIELKKELSGLIKAGLSLSSASKYLAKKYNLSKKKIYNLY